jgi:hypothetical protein
MVVVATCLCVATVTPEKAYAVSPQREQKLEARIGQLEKRLAELEVLLAREPNEPRSRATVRSDTQPAKLETSSIRRTAPIKSASRSAESIDVKLDEQASEQAHRQAALGNSRELETAEVALGGQSGDPPAKPSLVNEDAPQELNVLRENNVTLSPRGFEVSTQVDYATRHTDLQQDRGFLSTTSIRYGALRWLELSLTIPAGNTNRTTNIGPENKVSNTITGIGDVLVQANARIFEQTRDWPGVVFSVGGFLPTGRSPYNFSHYSFDAPGVAATPNPINLFGNYFSQNDWGTRTNVQFYKTVDPFILFFGFGIDYFFPKKYGAYTLTTGLRYHYNAGFSFAASEKTTLGFTLDGQYQQGIRVNGRPVFDTAAEPTLARLTIIQRIAKSTYLEPAISFGLNRNSPDFALGVGLRRRF